MFIMSIMFNYFFHIDGAKLPHLWIETIHIRATKLLANASYRNMS